MSEACVKTAARNYLSALDDFRLRQQEVLALPDGVGIGGVHTEAAFALDDAEKALRRAVGVERVPLHPGAAAVAAQEHGWFE